VVEARDAATVVLVRPAAEAADAGDGQAGGRGVEVLLQCRARAMDFAPGAYVFPGGSVDPRDAELDVELSADYAAILGVPPDRGRALLCAAVRETFEESGVLLADGPPPAGDEDRRALLAGTASMADVLRNRKLELRADALLPWARWITPEASDRRFDTWFFIAAMPAGQVADAGIGAAEADSAHWLRPAAALAAARRGEIMLPPTAVTLAEIGAHDSLADILAQRRTLTQRMPSVTVEDGQAWLTMPAGVEYPL
jgi:8-oxo-dGTP pyrophosphatase MutT (NUDIX family)